MNAAPELIEFSADHGKTWLAPAWPRFLDSCYSDELVADAAHRVNTLLAWRDAAKLKALADEELSFELELGSNPKPAQEYRPELRSQFPGGADLSKREVRDTDRCLLEGGEQEVA